VARKRTSQNSFGRAARRAFFVANLIVWGVIGGWYLLQPAERQAEVSRMVRNCFDARKQVSAFDVAWDLWQLYYSEEYVATAAGTSSEVYGGMPKPTRANGAHVRMLTNPGYTTGYSDALGNPIWTAYHVSEGKLGVAPPRPDEFSVDARTVARIEPSEFSRSGYDRGHMAPNHVMAVYFGPEAQAASFLMSNICPQKHGLNAGLWKDLEQRIAANYPARFREVWVFAGPVFGEKPSWLRRRVAVPEGFYMILLDEQEGRLRAEAFLFPQEPASGARLEDFLTSIDEVERRTGLDFLNQLPANEQAALEARVASRVW
jgi:endonuclease G